MLLVDQQGILFGISEPEIGEAITDFCHIVVGHEKHSILTQMFPALSQKLVGITKLHDFVDREVEIKFCVRKNREGLIGVDQTNSSIASWRGFRRSQPQRRALGKKGRKED
ncbi:MAG TPA: hypothetical protein PKK23_20930 [Nitrospirales bacterium]|nr:hypothetical protein [Nitrospiraceae bacterium]HNP31524.1 hypothetical protein [Nitrospirales bacterium]